MKPISGTGKVVRFVFGLQFAVLATVMFATVWGVGRLIDEAAWVSHTHQVMSNLADSMIDHTYIKVNTRSYLLVGGQHFLDEISASHDQLSLDIDKIEVLTRDNPGQQRNIDVYRKLIERHFAFSMNLIDLDRRGRRGEALGPFRDGEMEAMSRDVVDKFAVIQREEQHLLRVRNNRLASVVNEIYMLFPLMVVMDLLSVVVAYIITTRAVDRDEDNKA